MFDVYIFGGTRFITGGATPFGHSLRLREAARLSQRASCGIHAFYEGDWESRSMRIFSVPTTLIWQSCIWAAACSLRCGAAGCGWSARSSSIIFFICAVMGKLGVWRLKVLGTPPRQLRSVCGASGAADGWVFHRLVAAGSALYTVSS